MIPLAPNSRGDTGPLANAEAGTPGHAQAEIRDIKQTIGVTQVLNKQGGPFSAENERRLKAFTAQVAISLENAKLFDDLQNMKNYNESMLESMSNAGITIDDVGKIITCNAAGLRLLNVGEEQVSDPVIDAEMMIDAGDAEGTETLSINVTFLPLMNAEQKKLGSMMMVEDISSEKRMKSTMSRYMDPSVADR